MLPQSLTETTGPLFGNLKFSETDADLTRQCAGAPQGERIIIAGQVRDDLGKPIRNQLVEVWQANAAGRYHHVVDQHEAPLDPNFLGGGRCLTDDEGNYRFVTIRPGEYPWGNHPNAWRPAHVHFSLFGTQFTSRLVTQMYFPGDPLFEYDPIMQSVPERARPALVSRFDMSLTESDWALGYRFDIVLDGPAATPMEAK